MHSDWVTWYKYSDPPLHSFQLPSYNMCTVYFFCKIKSYLTYLKDLLHIPSAKLIISPLTLRTWVSLVVVFHLAISSHTIL